MYEQKRYKTKGTFNRTYLPLQIKILLYKSINEYPQKNDNHLNKHVTKMG